MFYSLLCSIMYLIARFDVVLLCCCMCFSLMLYFISFHCISFHVHVMSYHFISLNRLYYIVVCLFHVVRVEFVSWCVVVCVRFGSLSDVRSCCVCSFCVSVYMCCYYVWRCCYCLCILCGFLFSLMLFTVRWLYCMCLL